MADYLNVAFNRGLVSELGLARAVDIDRIAISAQTYLNFVPRVLGSMMLRPGLKHLGSTNANAAARYIPFVFATDDTALIELTDNAMRVWVNDALLTRPTVSSSVTNPNYTSNLNDWTDSDESGATSEWVTGGYMGLRGDGTNKAIREQAVSVAIPDRGVVHALEIRVFFGPVTLRVGSTQGEDDLFAETELNSGWHHIVFTPSSSPFWIQFSNFRTRRALVDSCDVFAGGTMTVTTDWEAELLDNLRYDQSADVIFVSEPTTRQQRIERRDNGSWSVVNYIPEDGPFRAINDTPLTITPSALNGTVTLTASSKLFRSSSHIGSLWRLESDGQNVSSSIAAQNTFTNTIRVTGVDDNRQFGITITGLSGTGSTVTLQRSTDEVTWTDVSGESYTTDQSKSYDDGLDNQIVYYRIGVKTGDYTAGTHVCSLQYDLGSITGIAIIGSVTDDVTATAEVLQDFGSTDAQKKWYEGAWSALRGFPSAVSFHEGRLWWFGKNGIWGSVSDAFDSFDDTVTGDSAPIIRTIGSGPVDRIHWSLSLQRLVLGAQGAEFSLKSNSLDEPITPTAFNLRDPGTRGSANVQAVKIDSIGVFVGKGGTRVFSTEIDQTSFDYESQELSVMVDKIGSPRIVRMAVQDQPDRRVHFVRSDGTVALFIYDKRENVLCWVNISSTGASGLIEDVVVLPATEGDEEDQIYYVVKRTINGSTKRYLEKWALESEVGDLTQNKQADSFIAFTNDPPSQTVTGLSTLEGESVVVWADGKCLRDTDDEIATFTVASGQITPLTNNGSTYVATSGVVGLAYTAQWKSGKLLELGRFGRALGSHKNVRDLAIIAKDMHARGLQYGPNFTDLRDLPSTEEWQPVDIDTVHTDYDQEPIPFPGEWNVNSRLCLQAKAPRPVTLLGLMADLENIR